MFFEMFPMIEYNGQLVRNLLANARIDPTSVPYHEYTFKDQDKRADVVAHKYYGGFDYDWLVWLSNEVVDPYYGLGLDQQDFDAFIRTKYGSQEAALEKIIYWRNNWRTDDSVLTPGAYESLPGNRKRYYQEVINVSGLVSGYSRKKEDWIVKTNKLVSLVFTSHSYEVGDKVTQGAAEGIVTWKDDTSVILENVFGAFTVSGSITAVTVLSTSFADDEDVYWEAVNAFEQEVADNDAKRQIQLVDNRYKDRAFKQIEDLFE